jgi:hypothetical protein
LVSIHVISVIFSSDYNNISRFSTQNINESLDHINNQQNKGYLANEQPRKSFVFDVEEANNSVSSDDGISDSTFSSIRHFKGNETQSDDKQNTLQLSSYQNSFDTTPGYLNNPGGNLQETSFASNDEQTASIMRF